MNKKELEDILKNSLQGQYTLSAGREELDLLDNVTTNLQGARKTDIVFYKVNSHDLKSKELFLKRLEGSHPGVIILNEDCESELLPKLNNQCVFWIPEKSYLDIQKQLLDLLFPNKHCMRLVGVTGTNGKTTTVNLAMQIASLLGHPAISIGTVGVHDEKGVVIADLESTTPSYVEIRKLIHRFQDKYQVCFMEVSSHALVQNRLYDLRLDAAAWTSFSQDHLDYHQNMDEYFKVKELVASVYLKKDQELIVPSAEIALQEKLKKSEAHLKFSLAKTLEARGLGKSNNERPLFYHSIYNKSNAEVAFELVARLFGEDQLSKIKLDQIKTPLGRFSVVELAPEQLAVVDYAHTPDALLNIGAAIREAFPGYFLTVVFGCGGNRDKTKRPLMGKAVASFADKVIVTSDNPRNEAPEDIIIEILAGIDSGYEAVIDREKAIIHALEDMKKKEVVLIAGKGHEEYQEIKGVKYPFSDFNIVMNFKSGR